MDATRLAIDQLASESEKYDVMYMNSPWGAASVDDLKALSLGKIAAPKSVLYFWASNAHLDACVDMIRNWGFKFHSVHQISEIAQHPWQRPPPKESKPKDKESKDSEMEVDEPEAAADAEPVTDAESKSESKPESKPKKTIQRKVRPAQVHAPAFFGEQKEVTVRNTTEQLWVAVRGDDTLEYLRAEKAAQLPYQISFYPEMGKKMRAVKKGPGVDAAWVADRPASIRDDIFASFKADAKILEFFGSQTAKAFDTMGPNIPGTFAPAHDRNFGISEALGSVLGTQKKSALTGMVAKIHKMLASSSVEDKRQFFDSIKETWALISAALDTMRSPVSYDVASVDSVPPEWLLNLVAQMASSFAASFVSKKSKGKGKSKSKGDSVPNPNPNRVRHGIAAPQKISEALADFLGVPHDELMARTTAVKNLNMYIKQKNLQNPDKKINISPDEPLRALLGLDQGVDITYFEICKYLGPHFIKTPKAPKVVVEGAEEAVEAEAPKKSKKRASVEAEADVEAAPVKKAKKAKKAVEASA